MTESCGYVFVDNVPLLYEKRRVARQLQVETWLYFAQLVKELGIENFANKQNEQTHVGYVV